MNKQRLLLCALLPLLVAGCFSVPTPADSNDRPVFDAMVNGIPFTQWARIKVSRAVLFKFDGYTLNLAEGSDVYVPSGRHTLEAGFADWKNRVTLEGVLVPGRAYQLDSEDFETKNVGATIISSASFVLRDYGFNEFAVPTAGQSIIQFNLKGYLTFVSVDGSAYTLDADDRWEKSARFFVSPGNHTLSSTALVSGLSRDVEPNRFISYTVDTAAAAMTLDFDRPLGLIGTWGFDIDGDGSLVFVLTFTPNGYGWVDVYENSVPNAAAAGSFTYTATDKAVTTTHRNNRGMTMEYAAAQDGNELILNNFWDQGLTVRGKRQ
jgi:uncharacterized protein YndB with AHSA1/START domain